MLAIKYESLKKRNNDLRKLDEAAAEVQRLKWIHRAAKRAAKAAGFIEQAKSAATELDAINAFANVEANRLTKSYMILYDWAYTIDISKFKLIQKIFEKNWLDVELFTIGDYLEMIHHLKSQNDKI